MSVTYSTVTASTVPAATTVADVQVGKVFKTGDGNLFLKLDKGQYAEGGDRLALPLTKKVSTNNGLALPVPFGADEPVVVVDANVAIQVAVNA